MSKISAKSLENNYYDWLKRNLDFNDDTNDFISITTPFVDINFDNITLYTKSFSSGNSFVLTDLGDTLFNLEMAGIQINKRTKREEILINILNNFGIKRKNNQLIIETDLEHFALAKTSLVQAIVNVYDLVFLSRNNVIETFSEIFDNFLTKNEIRFIKNISLPISGISASANFNFAIPSNGKSSEKFIKTINGSNNSEEMSKLFNYDVQKSQLSKPNSTFMLVINDNEKEVKDSVLKLATDGLNNKVSAYTYSTISNNLNILNA